MSQKQPYLKRLLSLDAILSRSVLLFGPRQTGKSTYLKHQISGPVHASYNLLNYSTFLQLSHDPTRIRQEVAANGWQNGLLIIDEIQKLPQLLDEIQLMIEESGVRFILTGSSARKLKRAEINLLGGRARIRHLHPLVSAELLEYFDLSQAIQRGTIPNHYFSDLPDEDIQSYIGLYLKEEIAAEGVTRNISAFSRFLEVAAATNTRMLNFTSVASDAQVSRQTAQNYFQILIDTLLGFYLEPYTQTQKRKAIGTPKFYFFDMGVVRVLRGLTNLSPASADYGEFFEHFIFLELRAFLSYRHPSKKLHYWTSKSGFEVDFIVADTLAIEVKSSAHISAKHFRGLKALQEEGLNFQNILLCCEERKRVEDGVIVYPWKLFLDDLWAGKLI